MGQTQAKQVPVVQRKARQRGFRAKIIELSKGESMHWILFGTVRLLRGRKNYRNSRLSQAIWPLQHPDILSFQPPTGRLGQVPTATIQTIHERTTFWDDRGADPEAGKHWLYMPIIQDGINQQFITALRKGRLSNNRRHSQQSERWFIVAVVFWC